MKRFLCFLLLNLLLVESSVFSDPVDDKLSNLGEEMNDPSPQSCSSNTDCGENECCFVLTGECYPKPAQGQSCSPESACPCAIGLVCKVYKTFGTASFYRCMKQDTE